MGTADKRLRQVRCLNCFNRIEIPPGVERYRCPHCGYLWRISWHPGGMAKIRGPVWEEFRRKVKEAGGGEA